MVMVLTIITIMVLKTAKETHLNLIVANFLLEMDVAANEDRHGTKKGKNILESKSVQTHTCTVRLHAKQGINNV